MKKGKGNIKIMKDNWDYFYIIAMVLFTGIIAYSTLVKIPAEISESAIQFRNYSDVNPSAIGPRIPYPVYGEFKLDGNFKENVNITLTNLNTNEQLPSQFTNANGEYVFDLSNLPHYFYYGDTLLIKGCIISLCTEKEIIVLGEKPAIRVDFDIY